MKQSALVTMLF